MTEPETHLGKLCGTELVDAQYWYELLALMLQKHMDAHQLAYQTKFEFSQNYESRQACLKHIQKFTIKPS